MRTLRRWKYEALDKFRDVWSRTIGMRLATYLDKKHPDWCWADLCVRLGLARNMRHWRECKSSSGCKHDAELMGSCWCGKMMRPDFREQIVAEESKAASGNFMDGI